MIPALDTKQLLDTTINLLAERGYAKLTPALVAAKLNVSEQEVRNRVGDNSAWISETFARLLERRLALFEEIADSLGTRQPQSDATWHALLQTVYDGTQVHALFAAIYEVFFGSRGDRMLLDRLLQIRSTWEPRIESAAFRFFPAATPAPLRRFILIQVEALGAASISNGSQGAQYADAVGKIVRQLLESHSP
jgi:AcrR family transcriptional regulator